MLDQSITSDEIFERTMRCVAPLPCQTSYLRRLAAILSFHIHKNYLMDEGYLPDDLPAMSAIVVAPTGQGKTFLLRKMVESLDLNLITVDCSTLAAEGWKGVGLGQRLITAQKECKDKDAFARSVLFLDEVDKLRFGENGITQGNPMSNFLQLYNSGFVVAEGADKETVNIDVTRFTVLLGGAFDGIEQIVENRVSPKSKIGFGGDLVNRKVSAAEWIQQVTKEDLENYGMLPELLGRIGTILVIPPLKLGDYRQLLRGENGSIQCKYHNYLRGLYGVSFDLTDAAANAVAQKCIASKDGARAATPIVNDLMCKALSAVEQDKTISRVILDAEDQVPCVRYEYGDRSYCYSAYSSNELPVHRIKGKSCSSLADKLCRYYRKAGGDFKFLPVLHGFLECTLEYLDQNALAEDFCFSSLEKMARTVKRSPDVSDFEIMLCGHRFEAFDQFQEAYTTSTPRQLVAALQQIMNYLERYHKRAHVQFVLRKNMKK